jgi:hypothetical protein
VCAYDFLADMAFAVAARSGRAVRGPPGISRKGATPLSNRKLSHHASNVLPASRDSESRITATEPSQRKARI